MNGLRSGQVLVFKLGAEDYAVDILCVREIRVWEGATRVPHTPSYVKGVMNLRGEVVPILDLRERFATGRPEYGPRTVVIVFQVRSGERNRLVGGVVDAVCDVYSLDEDSIMPLPEIDTYVPTEYIKGLVTLGDAMVIVLDPEAMFDFEDAERSRN